MINQELSQIFQTIADILEYQGANIFRIRAYKNAAIAILDVAENIEKMAKEKRLLEIPGIGKGIAALIEEYVEKGNIGEFEMMKLSVPPGFIELIQIPSLGPKRVKILSERLGVSNVAELKAAIASGKVQELDGFGAKSAQKIIEGIDVKAESHGRFALGNVFSTVRSIIENLKKCPHVTRVEAAGSFRRCEETVGDIDILAASSEPQKVMEYFKSQKYVLKVIGSGDTKTSILTAKNLQVDLRVLEEKLFGSALQYFTGSKLHNVHLRTLAKARGFKLSEYGFLKGTKLVASETEEECYASLGLQYIPPELRTDTGEIEAAQKHAIPLLIDIKDIKGDLHAHSTWSDGNDSIEAMVAAAQKRGYEYLAITDHSPSLRIARGLTLDRLREKRKEIDSLKGKYFTEILFGTEVDILADGSIDYPDEILKQFDIVVASVHSRFKQDNTARILKAMENPYVHIIGHPSGRRIGLRPPYEVNYEKIFKKAVATNTILEINGQHERLDLRDIYIRQAKSFGCTFSINSDSHSASSLGLMDLGVRWARRGWVEPKDVVNTLPLYKLKAQLK